MGLTGVKAIDDYTLEVKLRYPFSEFYMTLGHTVASAWPLEYAKEIGKKAFSQKPVGTGQYIVESSKNNQAVELVKNPDSPEQGRGRLRRQHPHADHPRVADCVAQLPKGSLDYSVVPPGQVAAAEANPEGQVG